MFFVNMKFEQNLRYFVTESSFFGSVDNRVE